MKGERQSSNIPSPTTHPIPPSSPGGKWWWDFGREREFRSLWGIFYFIPCLSWVRDSHPTLY